MLKQLRETSIELERLGFCLLKSVVSADRLELLVEAIEAVRDSELAPGLRHLLCRSEVVRAFAHSSVAYDIAHSVLGPAARPVRAILFDKTPASNWYVTWHQDLTIPVKARVDAEGYGPWSTKDGILHVQPPAGILQTMVSLRLHLDACAESNGAIKFIAGSHAAGILSPKEVASWRDSHSSIICPAERGDVIAMRPLVLHSSSPSQAPDHRRVLHLEYASTPLPAGMEWAEA
jgi:ectoine hydroxylase-related dioxygenase (phytanoyl-CoA dioxygenase family)